MVHTSLFNYMTHKFIRKTCLFVMVWLCVCVSGQGNGRESVVIRAKSHETLSDTLARYQGMHISIDFLSNLVVTKPFDTKDMIVSLQEPCITSTQLYPYGSKQEVDLRKQNFKNQLIIEKSRKRKSKGILHDDNLKLTQSYVRVGDRVSGLRGYLKFNDGRYRLVLDPDVQLTNEKFQHVNDRKAPLAKIKRTHTRIASFNLQNYFVSAPAIGGDLNPHCRTAIDASRKNGCNRGAKQQDRFTIQQAKLVTALHALNADIIGLNELENNGFGAQSAVARLTDALNDSWPDVEQHYQFVALQQQDRYLGQFLGNDAICVGLLYRPHRVQLFQKAQVLEMPVQRKSEDQWISQRDALVQAFVIGDKRFNVVVNHLKSKRGRCLEDEMDPDLKRVVGSCHHLRVSATEQLGHFVYKEKIPTLLMGDFNAYAREEPILLLTENFFDQSLSPIYTASSTYIKQQPLKSRQHLKQGFGLISFMDPQQDISYRHQGMLGTLDYMIGSQELADDFVQSYAWHINAHESIRLSYNHANKKDFLQTWGAQRSSDHNPLVVDFDFSGDS